MSSQPAVALTIAGSDSGGGAGIQADLKTFQAFGVFGTTALTAVTAQNTLAVSAVQALPAELVRAQIDAVVADFEPKALKSGMLATVEAVEAIAQAIQEHRLLNYVLDPVMVATSGDSLSDDETASVMASRLLPLATVVTPNLAEAGVLVAQSVTSVRDMREAARALVASGAHSALVKGGHLQGAEAIDVFWDGREERVWRKPLLRTPHTHGTGCTLSAGIAAALARGVALPDAVDVALDFVARAISQAPGLGSGHGPLNHFVPVDLPPSRA